MKISAKILKGRTLVKLTGFLADFQCFKCRFLVFGYRGFYPYFIGGATGFWMPTGSMSQWMWLICMLYITFPSGTGMMLSGSLLLMRIVGCSAAIVVIVTVMMW